MKRYRTTEMRPNANGSTSIVNPEDLKREEIANVRDHWQSLICTWLKRELPGAFASLGHRVPVIELSEFNSAGLPILDRRVSALCYSSHDYDTWVQQGQLGMNLELSPRGVGGNTESYATLSVRRSTRESLDLKAFGGNNERALVAYAQRGANLFAARFAINELLRAFGQNLAILRDEYFSPISLERKRRGREKLLRYWQQIIDTYTVASELTQSTVYVNNNAGDFRRKRGMKSAESKNLINLLDESARRASARLLREMNLITKIRTDLNNAFSILETQQANALMKRLTWINLCIAAGALAVATGSGLIAWFSVSDAARDAVSAYVRLWW